MTTMPLRLKVTRIAKELGSNAPMPGAPGLPAVQSEVPTFSIRAVSVDEKGAPLPNAQPNDIPVADESTLNGFTLGQVIDIPVGVPSL